MTDRSNSFWGLLKRAFFLQAPPGVLDSENPNHLKELVLYWMVVLGVSGGLVVLLITLPELIAREYWVQSSVDVSMYLLCLCVFILRGTPYRLRSSLIIISFYLIGLAIIYSVGPFYATREWLLAFVIFASLLLGWVGMLCSLSLALVTLVVLGVFINSGYWSEIGTPASMVEDWVHISADTFLLALMLSTVITYIFHRLENEVEERKVIEQNLRESEAKYRLLAENISDNIWLFDLTTQKFSYNSPSVERISGFSVEEALNRSLEEALTPSSLEIVTNSLAEELNAVTEDRDRNRSRVFELEEYHKNGFTVPIEVSTRFIYDDVGTPTAVIGVTRDISARKALQSQLRRAQKMEAIGTLAGGIAHDFNNILSIIMGYGEIAQEKIGKGENNSEEIDIIGNAALRARDLVQQILAFSRKSESEPEPLDLNQLISQAANLLKNTIPKMIQLDLQLQNGLPLIMADPTQLEQVIINFTTNACDAMPEGGRLRPLQKVGAPDSSLPA
jgi:PAS domain S-box-containing protein